MIAIGAATAVIAVAAAAGLWRWHRWVTTPPVRLALPPLAPATLDAPRMAAEWEPAAGVLIAWPLRLPRELVVALAADVRLHVTVADEASRDEARRGLAAWGVPADACVFVVAPQGDGWYGTRDWGPSAVFDASGVCHLADARYVDYPVSGPDADDPLYWLTKIEDLDFSPDDRAPAAVAAALGLPRLELPFAFTGGAVATDGLGTAFVTEAVVRENEALGVPRERLFAMARSMLGLERFVVLPNYETMGVHHVDCLLALLDAGRVLVKRPPRDHRQHDRVERVVQTIAAHRAPSGAPYEVLRVETPRSDGEHLANYTNALILNGRVYVPLFGIDADESALATWRAAMPAHEVLGFAYGGEEGWTYTDALHCRVKAITAVQPPDAGTGAHALPPLHSPRTAPTSARDRPP